MQINVTKEHIEHGERNNCNYCPVALAIREQIAGSSCVEVWSEKISFYDSNDELQEAETPEDADHWILEFDDNEPVEPFSFELEIN